MCAVVTPTFSLFEVYAGHSLAGMKYYHLILTLTVVLALPTITLAKEKGTGATADVEATIKKIEQELTDTIVKSDTSAFEKYLASDYLGKGTYKGKDITGQYRWLDVFVKRDGKWQIAIDQGTQIAKQ